MDNPLNTPLFETLIAFLQPQTLARMVIDLEEALEDWQYYPEDAPPETVRQEVAQILEYLIESGTAKAGASDLDFQMLLEQARNQQRAEDWPMERDSQEKENWLKDYE